MSVFIDIVDSKYQKEKSEVSDSIGRAFCAITGYFGLHGRTV